MRSPDLGELDKDLSRKVDDSPLIPCFSFPVLRRTKSGVLLGPGGVVNAPVEMYIEALDLLMEKMKNRQARHLLRPFEFFAFVPRTDLLSVPSLSPPAFPFLAFRSSVTSPFGKSPPSAEQVNNMLLSFSPTSHQPSSPLHTSPLCSLSHLKSSMPSPPLSSPTGKILRPPPNVSSSKPLFLEGGRRWLRGREAKPMSDSQVLRSSRS